MGCGAQSAYMDGQPIVSLPQQRNRFIRKQLIGKGDYAEVYKCIDPITNKFFAMKILKMNAKTKQQALLQISSLKTQIETLKKLNHPNIVKYENFYVSPNFDEVQIVMELATSGSLKQHIQKNGPLSETVCAEIGAKILKALVYLHDQCMIHRDLKCSNILIDQNLQPKISDFGVFKVLINKEEDEIAKISATLKGTPFYMAPEVLKKVGHNQSADIWSFGCLMIEMLSGKAPWSNVHKLSEVIGYITSGVHPYYPLNLSKECSFFLESCLDPIPSNRLTSLELLKHRFIDKDELLNYNFSRGNTNNLIKKLQKNVINEDDEVDDKKLEDNVEQYEIIDKCKSIDKKIPVSIPIRCKTESTGQYKGLKNDKKENKKSIRRKTEKQTFHTQINVDFQEDQAVISDEEELPADKYFIKRTLASLKSKKYGKDFSKHSTTGKIYSQNHIQEMQFSQSFDVQYRSQKQISREEQAINTMISRAQRNNLVEQQRYYLKQRDEEKKKWEEELKEGAQILKKELTSRYMFTNGL